MTFEIQIHAFTESGLAEDGLIHPDDFGPLLVDGGRVEIVHRDIRVRPDRMRHGTGILGKLRRPQLLHVRDPEHRRRPHARTEALIPENRQPLLEGQLEPVPARHPVARPVMEVFVSHHAFDAFVVVVRRHFGVREDVLRIEDVQALVLHGPGIEVIHRHDHEDIEVIFKAVDFLVPAHGLLERGHGMATAFDVLGLHPDLKRHIPTARRLEAIRVAFQITGDESKEVAGLRKGILPARAMPTAIQVFGQNPVAVGEQDRTTRLIGIQGHRIACHHIRAIQEPGDPPEPHGLALCAVVPVGPVEPHEGRIRLGPDPDPGLQLETGRHRIHGQGFVGERIRRVRQRLAIKPHTEGIQLLPIQDQGGRIAFQRLVSTNREDGGHLGRVRLELKVQIDLVDPVVRFPIVLAIVGDRLFFAHGWRPPCPSQYQRTKQRRSTQDDSACRSMKASAIVPIALPSPE